MGVKVNRMSLALNRMGDDGFLKDSDETHFQPVLRKVLSKEGEARVKAITGLNVNDEQIEASAIPFKMVLEVIQFLPYGNENRVMYMMLFLTGCRLSELDKLAIQSKESYLAGNYIFWQCGKNQHGQWRKEYLPTWYLRELFFYRETHKVYDNRLFGISWVTLRKYFNRDLRPHLSPEWKTPSQKKILNKIKPYKFNLKGYRKTFATLIFANEAKRWNDDYTVALHQASKRLRHSSLRITINHYICEFEPLEMNKWVGMQPHEILALAVQTHLPDYKDKAFDKKVANETAQKRLREWMM